MSKVNPLQGESPTARAAAAAAAATSPLLPPPNPFPPGVIPFRPSTEATTQPLPTNALAAHLPPPVEGFAGNAEFDKLSSRIVEVIDLDNPGGWPTYKVLPESATPSEATCPSASNVLGSHAATAVMFEDSPCPALDPSAKYWVSVSGSHAGVFNNYLFVALEGQSAKGKSPGPKSLNAAYDAWKRACLSGVVPSTKPISPNSVFPRVVRRARVGTKQASDAKAKRNKIITDFFLSEAKNLAERVTAEGPPTDDTAMAVDTVGNIFQRGATVRSSRSSHQSATTESLAMSPLPKTVSTTSKVIKKKRNLFNKIQSRPPSICSSEGSDSGTSSHMSDFDVAGTSSGYQTPPMHSLMLSSSSQSSAATAQTSKPTLYWAVIAGRSPGVYFSEETTADACGGCKDCRVTVYESFTAASFAYAAAESAGQIQVILD